MTGYQTPQAYYICPGCGTRTSGAGYCDAYCARRDAERRALPDWRYGLRLWFQAWATPVAGVVIAAVLLLSAWVMP